MERLLYLPRRPRRLAEKQRFLVAVNRILYCTGWCSAYIPWRLVIAGTRMERDSVGRLLSRIFRGVRQEFL